MEKKKKAWWNKTLYQCFRPWNSGRVSMNQYILYEFSKEDPVLTVNITAIYENWYLSDTVFW